MEDFQNAIEGLSDTVLAIKWQDSKAKALIYFEEKCGDGAKILGHPPDGTTWDHYTPQQIAVGELYAHFSISAEIFNLTLAGVPADEHSRYFGRGQFFQFITVPLLDRKTLDDDLYLNLSLTFGLPWRSVYVCTSPSRSEVTECANWQSLFLLVPPSPSFLHLGEAKMTPSVPLATSFWLSVRLQTCREWVRVL